MNRPLISLILCITVLGATSCAFAAEPGDPAPPLQISQWIKGKPVDLAAGRSNTIYVVEFWATWCPPCIMNIPHLAELQKEFKDSNVVVVGISSESADTVKKFVARKGGGMDYTVAVDDEDKTITAYASDPSRVSLPQAYIVDKEGRIVWTASGYPMYDLERSLNELLAGKFSIALGKKRDEARQKLNDFLQMASMVNDETNIAAMAASLETLDKEVGGIIPGKPFSAAEVLKAIKFQKAVNAYQKAILFDKEQAEIAQLEKEVQALAPADFDLAALKEKVDLLKTLDNYYLAVTGKGETNQIPALTKKIRATKIQDPKLFNQFAWVILNDDRIQSRDLELATRLAKSAVDSTGAADMVALHTYARALFDSGNAAAAIVWEKKALELADNDTVRGEIENAIKKYEAKAAAN
jgi:peroxiredoxin